MLPVFNIHVLLHVPDEASGIRAPRLSRTCRRFVHNVQLIFLIEPRQASDSEVLIQDPRLAPWYTYIPLKQEGGFRGLGRAAVCFSIAPKVAISARTLLGGA